MRSSWSAPRTSTRTSRSCSQPDDAAALPAAALREYASAGLRYRKESDELGRRFVNDLKARLDQATRVPGAGRIEPSAPARYELRWYQLREFPYGLLIGTSGAGQRMVVAVAQLHRWPGYRKRRLTEIK